ncbi:MAG: hypothetical protein ABIH23_29540 [bacterium]
MIISVNSEWRIKSDVRSWQVEQFCGKKKKRWRPVAWVNTLEQAKRRLLREGVDPDDLSSVEEKLRCKDPFNPDAGFCWQFDEVFPAGSPEAQSLAKMTISTRRDEDGLEPSPVGNIEIREKMARDDENRPELSSTNRLLIPVGDKWRIREDTLEWHVEKYKAGNDPKRSNWKPEAFCINLLDALNTLLQRRIRQIDGDDPKKIVEERETIRNEILSAWRKIEATGSPVGVEPEKVAALNG